MPRLACQGRGRCLFEAQAMAVIGLELRPVIGDIDDRKARERLFRQIAQGRIVVKRQASPQTRLTAGDGGTIGP